MIKLKLAISILVLLQVFTLPQSAKCSHLEETAEISSLPVSENDDPTMNEENEHKVDIPDLESEFVIPVQDSQDDTDHIDSTSDEEIIRSIEDHIAAHTANGFNYDLTELEVNDRNSEDSSNEEIEAVEIYDPEWGTELTVPIQVFSSDVTGVNNLGTVSQILMQVPLSITESLRRDAPEVDREETIKANIEDRIQSMLETKYLEEEIVSQMEDLKKTTTTKELVNEEGENEDNLVEIPQNISKPSKRNAPEVISVTVTAPKRKHIYNDYILEQSIYSPQYSTYETFKPYYSGLSGEKVSFAEPNTYSSQFGCLKDPLTITIDQSGHSGSYLNNIFKRHAQDVNSQFFTTYAPTNNYIELLQIHEALDIQRPSALDQSHSNPLLPFFKRSSSSEFPGECSIVSKKFDKRSATCGCSSCSKTTDSSCSPEIIEKPTFIIEELPETVEKPAFKVTETSETVTKPDFVVKEITECVPKPNFVVQEKIENVVKPKFVVEETSQKVKKPAFKVEEKPEVIMKPEFVIEETPEYIEKPEFTIEENVETVVKPKFKVETKTETVEKPNFVIKEHVHQVQKPGFVVTEKTEKVQKPEFNVEEKVEVVKKPKYEIQEQIVPIVKPNFIVEQTEVVVEKPEFVVTEEILPIQKPHYLIKETQEVVEKPEFYVTEIVETVNKPNYQVEETQETVTKPSYNVEEDQQTVKKPQFVVQEHPQFVVKPEFVVEETTIPVVKPEYIVEEVVENVQKPSYLVKPVPCYVEKPEFVVNEVVEKVNKPSYKVVEKKETVKKPSFVVEDEVQTVIKPCFNVVTCSGPPKRVAPKFSKSSHGHRGHYYSKRPAYHRRRTHRPQQSKKNTSLTVHS